MSRRTLVSLAFFASGTALLAYSAQGDGSTLAACFGGALSLWAILRFAFDPRARDDADPLRDAVETAAEVLSDLSND